MRRALASLSATFVVAGLALVASAAAWAGGLGACPHGYSCVPVDAVKRHPHVGNPDGRAFLATDPDYLRFEQPRVVRRGYGRKARRGHGHKLRRGHRGRLAGMIYSHRYGYVSLHGRTKFCSDHVEWHGRRGVRNCVWVLNSLLDSRGHRLERRGYRRH